MMSNYAKLTDKEFNKLAVLGVRKECIRCKKTYAIRMLPDESFIFDMSQIKGVRARDILSFLNEKELEFVINSHCVQCQKELYEKIGFVDMRRWLVKNKETGEYEKIRSADIVCMAEWRKRRAMERGK